MVPANTGPSASSGAWWYICSNTWCEYAVCNAVLCSGVSGAVGWSIQFWSSNACVSCASCCGVGSWWSGCVGSRLGGMSSGLRVSSAASHRRDAMYVVRVSLSCASSCCVAVDCGCGCELFGGVVALS